MDALIAAITNPLQQLQQQILESQQTSVTPPAPDSH